MIYDRSKKRESRLQSKCDGQSCVVNFRIKDVTWGWRVNGDGAAFDCADPGQVASVDS